MTVRRVFGGINVYCSFANATFDGATPETQTNMSEHEQEEESHLAELKMPKQTGISRSMLSIVERDSIHYDPGPRKISGCSSL